MQWDPRLVGTVGSESGSPPEHVFDGAKAFRCSWPGPHVIWNEPLNPPLAHRVALPSTKSAAKNPRFMCDQTVHSYPMRVTMVDRPRTVRGPSQTSMIVASDSFDPSLQTPARADTRRAVVANAMLISTAGAPRLFIGLATRNADSETRYPDLDIGRGSLMGNSTARMAGDVMSRVSRSGQGRCLVMRGSETGHAIFPRRHA